MSIQKLRSVNRPPESRGWASAMARLAAEALTLKLLHMDHSIMTSTLVLVMIEWSICNSLLVLVMIEWSICNSLSVSASAASRAMAEAQPRDSGGRLGCDKRPRGSPTGLVQFCHMTSQSYGAARPDIKSHEYDL